MNKKLIGFFLFVFLGMTAFAHAAVYDIDAAHSSVNFKVKHLLSNTRGHFREFKGTFEYDAQKPESWKAEAVIQTASIDTQAADRDKHLRSADFFDAEKYPSMTFKTASVTVVGENKAKMEGLLTLRGIEKPIVLDLEILGEAQDPWGNTRAAFTASGKINRKDFGMEYNKVLDTGGLLLGDEVDIIIEVEGIRRK